MVSNLETSGLLSARYFSEFIPELDVAREGAFERAGEVLDGSHLLFFDPDVGVEVKSTAYGARGSSRYVYWRELEAAWEKRHVAADLPALPAPGARHVRGAYGRRGAKPRANRHGVHAGDAGRGLSPAAAQPAHKTNVDFALKLLEDRFGRYFIISDLSRPRPRRRRLHQAAHAAEVPHRRLLERAGQRLDRQRPGPGERARPSARRRRRPSARSCRCSTAGSRPRWRRAPSCRRQATAAPFRIQAAALPGRCLRTNRERSQIPQRRFGATRTTVGWRMVPDLQSCWHLAIRLQKQPGAEAAMELLSEVAEYKDSDPEPSYVSLVSPPLPRGLCASIGVSTALCLVVLAPAGYVIAG